MSQKSLKSLEIPNYLIEKLNGASLFTTRDLISKYPMDLVRILNVPLSRIESLLAIVYQYASVPEPIDSLTLFEKHMDGHVDLEELDSFDTLLNENELLKTGILTEICGPPGVGKTQFLLKLCAIHLLDLNNSNKTVIYIDTENNFNPSR